MNCFRASGGILLSGYRLASGVKCVVNRKLKLQHTWPAVAAILIGAFIYVVYGADTLLINEVLRTLHFGGIIDSLREFVPESLAPIRNQVPDGLWVFAGTSLLVTLWKGDSSGSRCWSMVPLFLGLTGELGQLIHRVPGTFDWWDVVSMLVGYILGYGVLKKR
jgi:hypothetical protein